MNQKVFITCALTGSATPPAGVNFPVTPDQIVEQGLAAAEAGAAILHIHVRHPETARFSTELAHYRAVVEGIRARNNAVILNVTTGPGCGWVQDPNNLAMPGPGTFMLTAEQRVEHIVALKPEMCTLDLNTMQVRGVVTINLEPTVTRMAQMVREAGVLPEIECFTAGDFVFADDLRARGVFPDNAPFSFVLGTKYGFPATPEAMIYSRDQVPKGTRWTGFGVSRWSFPMAAQSVLLGGHVRVGFEDSVYLRQGRHAASNAEHVVQAVELIERLGRDVASVGETRAMLGLPT